MSRIGRKPIAIPKGVKFKFEDGAVEVSGPKGTLAVPMPSGIKCRVEGEQLIAERESDDHAAVHGLARALVQNAVTGVTDGFTRQLDIVGVGYKAERQKDRVMFNLGYSHPIEFYLPDGVDLKVDKPANNLTPLTLTGSDKQIVGQVAAKMRALRPPDPYKNKGIRYVGELLRKKVGKTGASGGK